jgi:hypothetical protein
LSITLTGTLIGFFEEKRDGSFVHLMFRMKDDTILSGAHIKSHTNRLKSCPCVSSHQCLRHLRMHVRYETGHHREIAEWQVVLCFALFSI